MYCCLKLEAYGPCDTNWDCYSVSCKNTPKINGKLETPQTSNTHPQKFMAKSLTAPLEI